MFNVLLATNTVFKDKTLRTFLGLWLSCRKHLAFVNHASFPNVLFYFCSTTPSLLSCHMVLRFHWYLLFLIVSYLQEFTVLTHTSSLDLPLPVYETLLYNYPSSWALSRLWWWPCFLSPGNVYHCGQTPSLSAPTSYIFSKLTWSSLWGALHPTLCVRNSTSWAPLVRLPPFLL